MSWRGVKKSISRLPHQFKTRNGGEDVTRDIDFLELEKKYKQVVAFVEEFRLETMAYRNNLAGMLNNQFHCAHYLAEVCGLVVETDDPLVVEHSTVEREETEDIPLAMKQALEDYTTAMAYCREESLAILDDFDSFVVRPADRFHLITRSIDKTITKREHKLIDFDRHRIAYTKYSGIAEPSPSEEKNMFKLQTQFDNAAADYDYFNNILKDELAQFLDLAQAFIEPVFQKFYGIQHRMASGFYSRLYEVIQHNTAAFPTLNLPIENGFKARLDEFNAREELDKFELFQEGVKPWQQGNAFSRYANASQQRQCQQRESYYSEDEDDAYSNTRRGHLRSEALPNHSSNPSVGGGGRGLSTSYSHTEHHINEKLPAYCESRSSIAERPTFTARKSSVLSYSTDRKPSFSTGSPISEKPLISEKTLMNNGRQLPRSSLATSDRSPLTSHISTTPPISSVQHSNYNDASNYDGKARSMHLNMTEELSRAFSSASSSSSAVSSYHSAVTTPTFTSSTPSRTLSTNEEGYDRRSTVSTISSPFLDGKQKDTVVKKKRAPPPPPPSKKQVKKELVEALYELNAPQDGDLSFCVGDLIEVLEKSDKTHDWWKGRLGDQTGMFPANYVRQF
ncbi:BAR domain-containing protein [Parasitella parasitica]|nr:BAR domain-containing protein [Parasitella parasitica]